MLSDEPLDALSLLPGLTGEHSGNIDKLLPLVYDELRSRARGYLGAGEYSVLQPTVLVHEAYMKIVESNGRFVSRTHVLAVAALAMRQILIDHIRRSGRAKRGGGAMEVTLDENDAIAVVSDVDFFALHEALDTLERLNARQARIVELRFFGGLTVEESAEVLGVSRATVENDWTFAKAWLRRRLHQPSAS